MSMKKGCISVIATLMLLLCFSPTAFASGGRITVTYNNGGSINVLSAVKMEGNVIYVEDDTKAEIVAVPNDGYSVAGVYLNDQSMNISGSGPQTILVAPKGTSVTLRITFIKSENMGGYTQPEPSEPPATSEPEPDTAPETPPTSQLPEQTPEPQKPSAVPATPPVSEEPDTPQNEASGNQNTDAPDTNVTSQPPDTQAPAVETTPSSSPLPDIEQQLPSVITAEISNGGVGGLTDAFADTAEDTARRTTILIVAGSLAVAAAVTIIIIRKGNRQ